MSRRLISGLLLLLLVWQPVLAQTEEAQALNYAQEVDIVFWQTLPFAVLWSNVLERQLGGFLYPAQAARWDVTVILAIGVSLTNAMIHAHGTVTNNIGGVENGQ